MIKWHKEKMFEIVDYLGMEQKCIECGKQAIGIYDGEYYCSMKCLEKHYQDEFEKLVEELQ